MADRPATASEPAVSPQRRVGRPAGPTTQGAASRDGIIDAAAAVFARLGYDRARMVDIVAASGLSKGSVYFHFDSKEALAVAVLQARQERWIADITARLELVEPGRARLLALLPAMLELHLADPDAWVVSRLSYTLAEREPTREVAAALARRWIDLVADVIGSVAPADPSIDPFTLATVAVGAFDGLKMTVDVLRGHDTAAVKTDLARCGVLLERLLFDPLGVD